MGEGYVPPADPEGRDQRVAKTGVNAESDRNEDADTKGEVQQEVRTVLADTRTEALGAISVPSGIAEIFGDNGGDSEASDVNEGTTSDTASTESNAANASVQGGEQADSTNVPSGAAAEGVTASEPSVAPSESIAEANPSSEGTSEDMESDLDKPAAEAKETVAKPDKPKTPRRRRNTEGDAADTPPTPRRQPRAKGKAASDQPEDNGVGTTEPVPEGTEPGVVTPPSPETAEPLAAQTPIEEVTASTVEGPAPVTTPEADTATTGDTWSEDDPGLIANPDDDSDDVEPSTGGPNLDTSADQGEPDGAHDISAPKAEHSHEAPKVEKIVMGPTSPEVPASESRADVEAAQLQADKIQYADRNRYLQSLDDKSRKAFDKLTPEEQEAAVHEWKAKDPRWEKPKEIRKTAVKIALGAYESFIASLPDNDAIDEFLALSEEEQNARILESQEEKVRKATEDAKKSPKERQKEWFNEREVDPKLITIELDTPGGIESHHVQEFLNSLSDREYKHFLNLSEDERNAYIQEWFYRGLNKLSRLRRSMIESFDEASLAKFESLSSEEKFKLVCLYRDGGTLDGYNFTSTGDVFMTDDDGNPLEAPSYFIYDKYKNERDGEEYFEVIQEHKRRYNLLTPEQRAALPLRERFLAYFWGKAYNAISMVSNFEARIAEENKHNQEMIRGIVDTGPDYNERIVFAQLQPDGVTYLDYNGNKVPAEIVRAAQKKALHNPSRFQALCHYELSKREETEQMVLWEEIFTMMAHHGYGKYAMWGVVVGLQFMNKPSYLAVKNAVIEWEPEYVRDAHGVIQRDDDGRLIEQRYTAERGVPNSIYDNKGKLKKDPDGNFAVVGEIVRSRTKARFATTDLILEPGDQEYDEMRRKYNATNNTPGEENLRYERRTRVIRHATEYEPEDMIEVNGELRPKPGAKKKVIRTEDYVVKKILKVKDISFAHEIAEKFMSFQYGFRSSDVMVTLDVARHALQTALACARRGDFTSKEFQTAQYVLARLKMTVDTTRLGGAGGEEMSPELFAQQMAQNAMLSEADIANARKAGNSEQEIKKMTKSGKYPPRISGTAVSNVLWDHLAKVVDHAADVFPNIRNVRFSDYEALQGAPAPAHH